MVGRFITPPNVVEPAYPKLSSMITNTLGAPAGALTSKMGGALACRASISVIAGRVGSAMGSTVLSTSAAAPAHGCCPPSARAPTGRTPRPPSQVRPSPETEMAFGDAPDRFGGLMIQFAFDPLHVALPRLPSLALPDLRLRRFTPVHLIG